MKSLYFTTPRLYDDLKNVKLPFSFSFILKYIKGELYATGICSTFEDIQWNELKMVMEGF
jgi:hypothetical protein